MKNIVLCADDYGQSASISQAIIALLEKKRLSAVSCMTTSAHWSIAAKHLKPFKNQVDIGLHFNLTEGHPLSQKLQSSGFWSLPQLLIKSSVRYLDTKTIEAECHAQLDAFVAMMGQLPDFLDGHQHVHHLPRVRDAVLAVYEQRLRAQGAYIRCVNDPYGMLCGIGRSGYIKKLVIQLCGAHAFRRLLARRSIPHNTTFSGVYKFSQHDDYKSIFLSFLQTVKKGGLIMCHPGLNTHELFDPIANARSHEYRYLMSEQFLQDCAHCQILIGRFKRPSSIVL